MADILKSFLVTVAVEPYNRKHNRNFNILHKCNFIGIGH